MRISLFKIGVIFANTVNKYTIMGISERKERQKREVRESILNAAWEMVTKDGWNSLSIRKIADAIEYSVPVVYDHFENKEAILSVFSKEGFRLLASDLKKAKNRHDEPAKQLEAIALSYWNFAFENKEYYQLMFGLGMPTCESVRSVPELMDFFEVIYSTIERLIPDNSRGAEMISFKAKSLWSTIHGLVSINMVNNSYSSEKDLRVLEDFISVFIKGLKN